MTSCLLRTKQVSFLLVMFLFFAPFFAQILLLYFSFEIKWTYNIMLVSDVLHSDLTLACIMK